MEVRLPACRGVIIDGQDAPSWETGRGAYLPSLFHLASQQVIGGTRFCMSGRAEARPSILLVPKLQFGNRISLPKLCFDLLGAVLPLDFLI